MAAKPPIWIYWLAAAAWTVLTVPGGYLWGHHTASGPARFEQQAPAAVAQTAFPGARVAWVGSGAFQVPAQASPGTYIVTASGLTFGCSWELRTRDDSKPKSVSSEGSVNRGETGQFTIGRADRLLTLAGDCMWRLA